MTKKKIAILGGGMASLTTAFELTNDPNWKDHYEINLYQLGWRVGGKTSTGRGVHDRIEEVGIHIFQGWYNNAFKILQQSFAYCKENNLFPKDYPFDTWQDAFEKEQATLLTQWFETEGKWITYNLVFPDNKLIPGVGGKKPVSMMIFELLAIIYDMIFGKPYHKEHNFWEETLEKIAELFGISDEIGKTNEIYLSSRTKHQALAAFEGDNSMKNLQHHPHLFLHKIMEMLESDDRSPEFQQKISTLLEEFLAWFLIFCDLFYSKEKRYWIKVMVEFGLVAMKGFIQDIYDPVTGKMDFDKINHLDFREWLQSKGLSKEALHSAPVRFIYTGTFANLYGGNGQIAAGTAMNFLVESMGYKGAFVWKFKAGTGDTLVAPVYLALQHRGVNFHFFNQVLQVHPDASGEIQKISMGRQVDLAFPEKPYNPLKEVKHIYAWPSEPLYEQLNPEQAVKLKEQHINLESAWTPWENVGEFSLEKGKDFDYVVLGIPIAALGGEKGICKEIIQTNQKWKEMYENVKTTITQSIQTWISPDYKELGMNLQDWGIRNGGTPNLVTYASPIYSWIDMSLALPQETWENGKEPKLLVYYCGSANDPLYTPPFSDAAYPQQAIQELINTMKQWLNDNMGFFWPAGTSIEYPQGFNLEFLFDMYDRPHANGEEKLLSQYWRSNVNPWDRYTLSIPKSAVYRLKTNESGYKNMFLTGDWTNFGVNVGYIEGAVDSGLLTATAIKNTLGLKISQEYAGELIF